MFRSRLSVFTSAAKNKTRQASNCSGRTNDSDWYVLVPMLLFVNLNNAYQICSTISDFQREKREIARMNKTDEISASTDSPGQSGPK